MHPSAARLAAELLWTKWQAGETIPALPEACRPSTVDDGHAVQAELERVSGQALAGWKIAATSTAGQAHINVTGPLAGRLLARRVLPNGAAVPFGANRMRVAEAEFAFRFGRDLPPRAPEYSVAEVLDAVAALHPAIEIPDSRYDDFVVVGAAQLIADNACAHYFVLGPPSPVPWRDVDLVEYPATLIVDSLSEGRSERDGKGANVLGDPRIALAWLVNEVSRLGTGVKEGQVVTTGTCVTPIAIDPDSHVVADFGAFGKVTARLE